MNEPVNNPQSSHAAFSEEKGPSAGPSTASRDFVKLFLEEQRKIYCYIVSLLGSAQDAEDLLQETASILWEKFDEFRPGSSFFSWACQTAHYLVLNYRRKKSRRCELLDHDVLLQLVVVEPGDEGLLSVRRSALQGCLAKLAERDRALIVSRYAASSKTRDLAAKLGRPADSVSRSLGRIRRALLECIRRSLSLAERQGGGP